MHYLFSLCVLIVSFLPQTVSEAAEIVRTTASGNWSDASTWENGKVPVAGDRVQIRPAHTVLYDVDSQRVIRSIHVAGVLRFASDRDTELNVGVIRIHGGETFTEDGFASGPLTEKVTRKDAPGEVQCLCCQGKAALLVGTPEQPIPAKFTAAIRLHYIPGMDKKSCPAIVNCGGRMDFHGAPLKHTWVKLGKDARYDDTAVVADAALNDWQPGDRIVISASGGTSGQRASQTEVRIVKRRDGNRLTFDRPLRYSHWGEGEYRSEVGNLTRNVVVESADPEGVRGHTMYHHGSSGSISYAEFRHLGKRDILGRYAIHYHLCKDTMRGSSVVGASIWDSHNRLVTIHGTEYLVVRDCVGYKSVGHAFFLEDGTEVFNVLDHNFVAHVLDGNPQDGQALPFDDNSGAAFWWANCNNSITRNVASDCSGYGFRFEATPRAGFDEKGRVFGSPRRSFSLRFPILHADGTRKERDIRTLPFVKFAGNEAHHIGNYGLNMGEGAGLVSPDRQHPFVIREMKIWHAQRGYTVHVPNVLIDGMKIYRCGYEIYRARYTAQDYRNVELSGIRGQYKVSNLKEYLASGQAVKEPGVGLNRSRLPGFPKGTGAGGTAWRPKEHEVATLEPVDDQPPVTVITRVTREGDQLRIQGTTTDDGIVKQVQVNSRSARAITPGFSHWEVLLDVKDGDTLTVTAHAEDIAGNREKLAHKLPVIVPLLENTAVGH